MRKAIIFVLEVFLSTSYASGQSTLVWNNTDTVIKDLAYGNTRPKIALTGNNVPLVMWGRSINKEVFVSRYENDAFGLPVQASPVGMNTYIQNWVGPDMVAQGDTVYVTFKSLPETQGYIYVVRSLDGGKTFEDTVRVSNNVWSRFPSLGIRPDGNPIVTYMEFDSNFHDPRYVVTTSTDWGITFSNPVDGASIANGEACDCCPGFVMGDENETYLLFRNNDNNMRDIWTSKSINNAVTFPVQKDIDPNEWLINSCPSTGPDAYLTEDSVLSTWMSAGGGEARINIGVRDRTTLSIGQNIELLPESTEIHNYPKIHGNEKVTGVVWQGSTMGNTDILFVRSETGVQDLSSAVVDTVNSNRNNVQMNPDIEFANGTFHIIWQDMMDRSVKYRSARIESANGIERNISELSLVVLPNPTDGIVSIRPIGYGDRVYVSIFNNLGQEVYNRSISGANSTKVDVSSLSSGVYNVIAVSERGSVAKRIIVQN